MTERLGKILDNRGAILLYLGRGNEALAAREAAAAVFAKAGHTLSHAKALNNLGETYRQLANYPRSLDALTDKSLLLLYMANAYLELNLYSEALACYQEANELLRGMGMAHDRARGLWGMGSALAAQSLTGRQERSIASSVGPPTIPSTSQTGMSGHRRLRTRHRHGKSGCCPGPLRQQG